MPPYWRKNYYYYNRRRKWRFRRRRFRKPFRPRYRRYTRVRKQKLSKITIREFQPPSIKKCKIKGQMCLVWYNNERIGHNSVMYENSITPEHWPGGGGFSIVKMSLETLYDLHTKCRNWWTTSNAELPLCRYLGTKIRMYQCDQLDYVVKIQNTLPARSNKLSYPSCHPNYMLMSRNKIVIPSRKNERRRKPYKTHFIKPPSQLNTHWYFQVDMYKTPLFVLHTSACNLQDYFIKPTENNNTVTFQVLNTQLIQNRQMKQTSNLSWHYKTVGTVNFYMYRYDGNKHPNETQNFQLGDLCPLTQLKTSGPGHSFHDRTNWNPPSTFTEYLNKFSVYWGNPFNPHNLQEIEQYYITQVSPESLRNQINDKSLNATSTWQQLGWEHAYALTQLNEQLFFNLQYNPLKDTGHESMVYLLPNTSGHGWDPPGDDDIILSGFPTWTSLYGYIDFQKKLEKLKSIDTEYILVFKSNYTQKPFNLPIVPISTSFTLGTSPYENEILPQDNIQWYPQVQFQEQEINKIIKKGPATPNIEPQLSENIKIYYTSYWKWGGNPPKTVDIENPSLQEQYPIPHNESATNSLQNPAQAPETVLYSFDYRHGNLTKTALQRITDDYSTQKFIDSFTDPATKLELKKQLQALKESEDKEEKESQKIQLQLSQLRHEQHSIRKQIISLMTAM
nr:MAG: ORF1 [TTV-like mini virus]UGV34627.1 MAG: ORF1 [TTV-like mini virus]UGV34862.1 MAG: ORF1 [TTV-like mini virus]UGV37638.1 MAG: ORF1 [TTV-like mini virus]UGV39558.1 MAG: ORF1 [TTV-like mini virus]